MAEGQGIKLFGATITPQEKQAKDHKESKTDSQTVDKRPDTLPCPRCKSTNTKFCYYNNYNVNQPRHFCKACERYWTIGGTLRNVSVGGGRRKNRPPWHSVIRFSGGSSSGTSK